MLSRFAVCLLVAAVLCSRNPTLRANSSNSLMDVSPDGTRLLVANPDNGTVTVVDTAARKAAREIKAGDKAEGVTWIGSGPLAAVAAYHENKVVIFNADDGRTVATVAVPAEPYGIVSNQSGSRLWVTHEYPGLVSEIELNGNGQGFSAKVGRKMQAGSFVRGLALSPDEKRLYVTEFYTGILRAIDLASGEEVDHWKGHSTDNLCRNVVVHPRRPKAYLSHLRSQIDVIDGRGSIFPQLSVCSLVAPDGSKRRTSFALDTYNGVYVVTNPWEAALSPDGKRLYTIYAV